MKIKTIQFLIAGLYTVISIFSYQASASCQSLLKSNSSPHETTFLSSSAVRSGSMDVRLGKGIVIPTSEYEVFSFYDSISNTVIVANLKLREVKKSISLSKGEIYARSAVSPDGSKIALITDQGAKIITDSQEYPLEIKIDSRPISQTNLCYWSPNGEYLAVKSHRNKQIRIFDHRGKLITVLKRKLLYEFQDFTWNPQSTEIATTENSRNVRIFQIPGGKKTRVLSDSFFTQSWGIIWPTENSIFTSNAGPGYTVWDLTSNTPRRGSSGSKPILAWQAQTVYDLVGSRQNLAFLQNTASEQGGVLIQVPQRTSGPIVLSYIDRNRRLVTVTGLGEITRIPLQAQQLETLTRWFELD